MSKQHRTFLAIDIDDETRESLGRICDKLARQGDRVNWVARRNMHVTVKFLGDVDDGMLAEICDATKQVAGSVDFGELSLQVERPVVVPSRGHVRMVWAPVLENTGQLARLFGNLEDALKPLGFAREARDFLPHITLGRVKYAADPRSFRHAVSKYSAHFFGEVQVDSLTVYTSELTKQGPIYTTAATCRFGQVD